jgi:hypothetical protein
LELKDLLVKIEEGVFAIPEVQRHFVWRNPQIVELFNSIYQGFPIGSIIVWEAPNDIFVNYSDLFRPLSKDLEGKTGNFRYIVIDGQQRLLSMLLAKRGRIRILDQYGKERTRSIQFFFDLDMDRFQLIGGEEIEKDALRYYNVVDLLNREKKIYDILSEKGVVDQSELSRLYGLLEKVRENVLYYHVNFYHIPETALKYTTNQYGDNFLEVFEKISKMFVSLNMSGTRVKAPQLLLAVLTGKTRREIGKSFRKEMVNLLVDLSRYGWDVSEGVIMRTYLAISTGQPSFREAKEKLEEKEKESKVSRDIMDALERMKDTLGYVIERVLSKELNIKSPKHLKSEYLIVTISYYSYLKENNLSPSDIRSLKKWLVLASFNGRYTGKLESDIKDDFKELNSSKDINLLIKYLGTREIQEEWFNKPYDREHITALLILLKDAYDLERGSLRKIGELDKSEIQIHHIFPANSVKRFYKEMRGIEDLDVEEACNHIANITIVSKKVNKKISSKSPTEYLKEIGDREIIQSHMIPLDEELWKWSNYGSFLEERRKLIVGKLRELFK